MGFGLLVGGYLLTRPIDGSSGKEIASEVGFNHVQKYQQIHGGAGTGMLTSAAGGWSSQVAKKFDAVNSLLAEANSKAGVAWQGQAAEAHGGSLKPMTTFVTDAKDVSTAVGTSTERQVDNYSTVRNTMPEPKKVTATDSMLEKGGAWLFGTQTDLQQQEQEAMERAQEAQRLYGNYEASSSNETASLPYYPAAPKMTYSGDGYQGGGQVGVDGGGGYTGGNINNGGGTTYSGGGSDRLGNGSGVDWAHSGSGNGPGGGGTGSDGGSGSDGNGSGNGSGDDGPADNDSAWVTPPPPGTGSPTPLPGTGVGGGTGGGVSGGVIGGVGVGGGRGGSGRGGTGRGGTASGYGRGGSGYGTGSGSGTGGRAGSGSGLGAGGRSGSGLGAGGRTGSGMPSTSSSAYSSGTSSTTARGGAMAGAGARGADGEEDEEHENKYMVPTDEAWEDLNLPRTAPPVIGGDLEPPQR